MTKYGFLRDVEADLLDRLLVKIVSEHGGVTFLEIGVFGGGTVTGVVNRCKENGWFVHAAGVDFPEWKPNPVPFPEYEFYPTDSMDAWRDIPSRSFNLLFVDGCHCVNHAMSDFLNYSPFVVKNGYCLFHDTALPKGGTTQGEWPQYHGYAGKPDSVLGVREGLKKLGLLQGYRKDWELVEELKGGDDGLMGMCLFRKLKDL